MQQFSEHPNKFFVGGINIHTSEERLREYFERFGPVVECNIQTVKETGRSRGFAFVTFDPSVDPNVILNTSHELDTRFLDVKPSIPRQKMAQFIRVYVAGIPPTASEEQVRQKFSRFGQILDFVIPRDTLGSKGHAIITFADASAASAALAQPTEIDGVVVEVRHARAHSMLQQQQQQPHFQPQFSQPPVEAPSMPDPAVARDTFLAASAGGGGKPLDPKFIAAARYSLQQLQTGAVIPPPTMI
ncbi:hypothetical protein GEMRC1_012831 [Eukaryota sp. GEM-RC1]